MDGDSIERAKVKAYLDSFAKLKRLADGAAKEQAEEQHSQGAPLEFRYFGATIRYAGLKRPGDKQSLRWLVLGPCRQESCHWWNEQRKTVPCVAGCWLCPQPRQEMRYYPGAYRPETETGRPLCSYFSPGILEARAATFHLFLAGDQVLDRGLELVAARGAKLKVVELIEPDGWPVAFDPLPYLEAIFGMSLRRDEEENRDVIRFPGKKAMGG